MSTKCRHCRKVIVRADPPVNVPALGLESYWYHPKGNTVYCDLAALNSKRAEPA